MQKRTSQYYLSEAARLDKEIGAFYQQYGNNNIIQFRNLMLRMNKADRQLLMRNCDEFIKKYPQYANLLPVRENIYKLNRLEGLQASLRVQQLNIGVYESKQIEQHLKTVGAEVYEEISRTLGHEYNPEIVKKFVDGLTITDTTENTVRNHAKLADYLSSDIAQAFARGDSYKRIADSITNRFKRVSQNDLNRLVYTQGTLVYNEATAGVVEEDFDEYEISTAGDSKVCDICRGLEYQSFRFKDRTVGVNFPPLHPWCRCSFTVVVTDRQKWIDDYVQKHSGTKEDAEKIIERV
jgi:SPP1 gp7 family putative phage head morphogenesis protein